MHILRGIHFGVSDFREIFTLAGAWGGVVVKALRY